MKDDAVYLQHIRDAIGRILSYTVDLFTRWPDLQEEERRRLVESITESIVIGKDAVDINLFYFPNREKLSVKQQNHTGSLLFCHLRRITQKPLPVAYPKSMTTIGDHIRKRRLDLGLFQQQVGKLIGADEATIKNWETHATEPMIHCLPKIIEFLGYNPLPLAQTLSERIIRCRRTLGLSRRELSRRLGVDEGTLWRWEAGMRQLKGKYLEMVRGLL